MDSPMLRGWGHLGRSIFPIYPTYGIYGIYGYGKSGKSRIGSGVSLNFRMYVYELCRNTFSPKLAVSVFRNETNGDYREKIRVEIWKREGRFVFFFCKIQPVLFLRNPQQIRLGKLIPPASAKNCVDKVRFHKFKISENSGANSGFSRFVLKMPPSESLEV